MVFQLFFIFLCKIQVTKFAYFKVPDNEPKWKAQIEKQLAILEGSSREMKTEKIYEMPGL